MLGSEDGATAKIVHIHFFIKLFTDFEIRLNPGRVRIPDLGKRVEKHLREVGLPVTMGEIPGELPPAEVLLESITQDKKVKGGKLTFILTRGLGQSFVADDVPASEVLSFLREKLEG